MKMEINSNNNIIEFFEKYPDIFPDLWKSVITVSLDKFETTDYEFSVINEIINAELLKVEKNARG